MIKAFIVITVLLGFMILALVGIWSSGIDDSDSWTEIFRGEERDDI